MASSRELSTSAYKVCYALKQPGCAICRVTEEAGRDYLDALFYEMVNDVEVREKLRASRGFCRRHAAFGYQAGNALGAAIIYRDLLMQFARGLDNRLARPVHEGLVSRFRGRNIPGAVEEPCPACQSEAGAEERAIAGLLEGLAKGMLQAEFEQSAGLCINHFERTRAACRDKAVWQQIAAKEKQVVCELLKHLDEFIRKHDYRFSHEGISDEEAESRYRAIQIVSTLCRLDREHVRES
jgi:hypothetical protein